MASYILFASLKKKPINCVTLSGDWGFNVEIINMWWQVAETKLSARFCPGMLSCLAGSE